MIRIFIDYLSLSLYFFDMTKNRKKLLELLKDKEIPMNASLIHEETKKFLDLATIYRGLNFLENNQLVTSFVFDCKENGIQRYYTVKKEKHEHYMHCEKCHSFTAIPLCPFKNSFKSIEEDFGFIVDDHYLTLKGVCRNCSDKQK